MTHLAALILCLAGFAALSFGAGRQQEELFGRELTPAATATWRCAGALLLVTALALLVAAHGWGLALVMFSGHTSLAAGLVHLSLAAWSRRRIA
ncbi:MAG: hypothetical protein K0R58_534 [Ramlibacter sp.]|jgi:hypothetical protein|nr:hypothetical protein [Ramlibacter sp.]